MMGQERNDSGGEVGGCLTIGKSSPGQPSILNTQHHLEHRLKLFSVETERCDKMVRVQFSDAFDHGDEFWILLKRHPALVDIGNGRVYHD